jgi:hypothetical protein
VEQRLRELAKKVVSAYKLHGDEAYYHALMSITGADMGFHKLFMPFVEKEMERAGYEFLD